jgi:hypothetical protein
MKGDRKDVQKIVRKKEEAKGRKADRAELPHLREMDG